MKCLLDKEREVRFPCSKNCPLFGDCVCGFEKERKAMSEVKLTFYQWLNAEEFLTKREFRGLPKDRQEHYRAKYKLFLMTEKGGAE